MVTARPKVHFCSQSGCVAGFAERKELNRHLRTLHPPTSVSSVAPTSSQAGGDPDPVANPSGDNELSRNGDRNPESEIGQSVSTTARVSASTTGGGGLR